MKKHRMRAVLLAGLILMSLAGCTADSKTAESTNSAHPPESVATDVISDSELSDDITAETAPADDTVSSAAAKEQTTEKENDAQQSIELADIQKPVSSPPAEKEEPETSKPAPTEPPKQMETSKKEETKPADPPAMPPPTEPSPSEPEPTVPPAPAFDIDYWITYAQNYAISIGLRLESSAVDCWDNPIVAGAQCIYLERDIGSRLNRYNRDEDITDVWIWSESRADGSYDLYIGYA